MNLKSQLPNESSSVRLSGVVERVTFHNAENGWSVLKVAPFDSPGRLATVLIHQAKVFAGSSVEFWGCWGHHPKHGDQFKAERAVEKKPATSAALEKYLGSGLIKGVGPKTAQRIVRFFKDNTLDVFENRIDDLLGVPGIAEKKLLDIKTSWQEHKSIRDVMLFLQGYGISTLFAVKIYKSYGNGAIETVSKNPYQLAKDIYGIGFFSADKIALAMGFELDGSPRIEAGIKHVLSSSRDEGHCYLTQEQIIENATELLKLEQVEATVLTERIVGLLGDLLNRNEIKLRVLTSDIRAYYSNSLYFDEQYIATRIKEFMGRSLELDLDRVKSWVQKYCEKTEIQLSTQQKDSVVGITSHSFSILTGGPGCGKTTTTKVLVKLLFAMNKRVLLAAPTGRAAQRMSEVIGSEAKTIHRLLEVDPTQGGFKKSEKDPLHVDFLIIDECSMLDTNLTAALFKAVPQSAQVLFIGDPDQLPSVGAGNVLYDLLQAQGVKAFRLTQIFRQAEESMIIRFAHQINKGEIPKIDSPLPHPQLWKDKAGCVFIDAEEATQDQIQFLQKAKLAMQRTVASGERQVVQTGEQLTGVMSRDSQNSDEIRIEKLLVQEFSSESEMRAPIFVVPDKFRHVNLEQLHKTEGDIERLKSIVKSVHPWSALHYGMTGLDVVLRLYSKTIPEYFGRDVEIQILTPQIRGTLGTLNLNKSLQNETNPERPGVKQIVFGDRIYRVGDRVIQTRNNYDLGVYNGDIGKIVDIDLEEFTCLIQFGKQAPVVYEKEDLTEINLAYGITIHKSQGSEFDAVIIPVATQHFKMLFRNLIYTGLTRAKRLCVFVGSRKALAMAVRQVDNRKRQTALTLLIDGPTGY
ncbi:MAG: AAA family ATPase [Bdellovibrionia bacterium]